MKKYLLLIAAALLFALSACQNVEPQAPVDDEVVICLNASIISNDGPATRTVFVPEGKKVNWVTGDKIAAKYPAGKDNVTLTLASGAGTTSATFSGKIANTNNTNLADNPSDFVFYYPIVSGVGNGGSVTDADNFILNNTFPKVQNSADILFEANWLYGTAKAQDLLNTVGKDYTMEFEVSMMNLMAVLDFTVKGSGSLKRIYVTDMDESAPALWGPETLTVKNGKVQSLVLTGSGTNEYDRTIIAEFNKPVALSSEGVHVYVTIFPRGYKGLRIGFEKEDGDYMVKNLAENASIVLQSNMVYSIDPVSFNSTAEAGKGYYDGVEYSYETFTDARDNNVYKIAKLKDGKTWMLDNLRYVPEGITPSKTNTTPNNGVWYPVVINAAGTGVQFGTDADVARYGYCYSFSTAVGKEPDYAYKLVKEVLAGTKTAADAKTELAALDGVQGICPTGWHVAKNAEYTALYMASGQSLSGLGAQGFILKGVGAVMVANPTASNDPTTSSFMGYANNKLNTGYYILSSVNSHTQSQAIMPNVTNNTAAVSNMNIRAAAPLRCIKDN